MNGFTLVELLIVIAIVTILAALGVFMSLETLRGTFYRSEEAVIVSLFEKARSRAMNNINQSPWGVCYEAPNYIISKGASCGAATAIDFIPANANVASSSDFARTFPRVVFTQLSGTTTATTTTVQQGTRTATITVNYEGTILW